MKTKKNSDCKSQSPSFVTSKYFTNKIGMDDSLKDFQEPKIGSKGPKISKNKTKGKKGKKPKGQSDIRTVLQKKKNELVAYNHEFNEMCREGGVDVDSEQLQIAIAMSKSLEQNSAQSSCVSSKVSSMSSQERCNKIRTTLLEYGFHVPDIKINTIGKRKKGKQKPSKLLLMSENERQQLISDKYSQILFNMGSNSKNNDISTKYNGFIFDICTNRPYEHIKHNNIFYLEKMFEPSNNDICSLLRDWSEIPGRPSSPIQKEKYDLKFSDVTYTQEELDIVLSGRLNIAKTVVRRKQNTNNIINKEETINKLANIKDTYNDSSSSSTILEKVGNVFHKEANITLGNASENSNEVTDFGKNTIIRSLSPDMFDDSELVETETAVEQVQMSIKKIDLPLSQPSLLSGTSNKSQEFMDLTECINPNKNITNYNCYDTNVKNIPCSQTSEKNFTRKKSDDFMDLTECIKPNAIISQIVEEPIDLTQNSNDNEMAINGDFEVHASLDLTQSSDSNDSTLPYIDIKGPVSDSRKINKVVVPNTNIDVESNKNNFNEVSSSSITEVIIDNVLLSRVSSEVSLFDDFVYSHSDHSSRNSDKTKNTLVKSNISLNESNNSNIYDDSNVDLTQSSTSSEDILRDIDNCSTTLNYERSEIILTELFNHDIKERSASTKNSPNKTVNNAEYNSTDITNSSNNLFKSLTNISKLGKYNDESIDYSEEYCSSNKVELSKISSVGTEISDQICSKENSNLSQYYSQISSSQCSISDVVFEISDEELDYSMHKSKSNKEIICNAEEITFNNEMIFNNSKRSTINNTMNNSLPAVDIKGTKVKIKSPVKVENIKELTPIKASKNDTIVSIETPKNSDYIIKTNNVTPMMNYESLSTPEVNQELNKFGLKPFKRKRAIQLLQHLYNQTHPIVEKCVQNELSFRKRFKPNIIETNPIDNNPSTSFSIKLDKEERNSQDIEEPERLNKEVISNKEEDILLYEETEALPKFRDIQCDPDDWVFQKREKAKLHSCQVPLHIVFHNYVSCRRYLQQAILCYRPIQIDVIHKHLVQYGYKFDPKDLLRFMDKKCITVKTSDNARNTKQTQAK